MAKKTSKIQGSVKKPSKSKIKPKFTLQDLATRIDDIEEKYDKELGDLKDHISSLEAVVDSPKDEPPTEEQKPDPVEDIEPPLSKGTLP